MKGRPPPKAMKLPKIRTGIAVAFNDYDIEGKPQWIIHDPGRNKFFLIGWLEFEILERWPLGTINAIVDSINKETTLHVEPIDIENFFEFLKRSYLIEMSGYEIHRQAKEQQLFKDDNIFNWLVSNYLFFRIPLIRPDAFLTRTHYIGRILFSKYTLYIMSCLALIALYQLSNRWDLFTHTFASVFTIKGIIFSMMAFLISKFCHELGHAYMCKSYGVPVPTFGVAFLVFWPVLYTDTTLSWALNNRERLRIALAGIWVETYITIIAALLWCNVDNDTLKTICYVSITVNWMASLIVNVSPFMRFDGYYVFADYLKMPNLQFRAFALTRWWIRQLLFGWTDPPPEVFSPRMKNILIAYSLITWIYRLSVYFGIALLVYHFFAKAVGIILFLIEIYYFILAPFVHEASYWFVNRSKFILNTHTKITLSIVFLALCYFFIPFGHTMEFPSTLSYTHEFLYAPESGILQKQLPPQGSIIHSNQPIATIDSPQLQQAILETQLEYDKTVSQLRRAAVNPDYTDQTNVLLSDLKRLRAEYQKLLGLQNKLVLSVPFNGILAEVNTNLRPGTYIMKNQWLGDVIKPGSVIIEAFVSQIDINYISIGAKGYFYAHNYSVPAIPVTVTAIETMHAEQLDCQYSSQLKEQKDEEPVIETPCYNASELGGGIPAYQSNAGEYVPTSSVYRIVLSTDANINLHYVERGSVMIDTKSRSYAQRAYYKFKSILIEELGF